MMILSAILMVWDTVLLPNATSMKFFADIIVKKERIMKKTKVYILTCVSVSIMLPVFLSAAPIDKYYVPPVEFKKQAPQQQMPPWPQQIPSQQQAPSSRAQTGGSDVDTDFRNKVSSLSDAQKKELKE